MFRATAFFDHHASQRRYDHHQQHRLTDFDGTDLWQLSRGTGEACRQVEELLQFMPKYIPGYYEQCALSFIAPVLGVRETRRFWAVAVCRKRMRAGAIPRDTIALCGYNVDIHHGRDEGSELYIVERGYGIPYGCMVPGQMDGGAVHRAADFVPTGWPMVPAGLWAPAWR